MANKSSVTKSAEITKSAETKKPPKVVVIFPAKNEADTIKPCIEVVKQSKYEPAIIVADGHSTDKTRDIASENGAEIVMPEKRIHPGKGLAMKTGLKAALAKNPAVIVFLDSDIKNLTVEWLDKLVTSILKERHDMARGMYLRHPRDAGVTKLVAKPLLRVFFPEVAHFDQPLSGEVAAKAEVWKELLDNDPPNGWGVDVWFLIEAAMRGYRIQEVFLGTKNHGSFADYVDDLAKLSKMGEQVALAIIREAIKYQRIDNVKEASP
jgi:glycosyltransferase involved in cell wall biosynthesis